MRGASPEFLRAAVGAAVFVAISVAVYSLVQVRKGRWLHVDASVPRERSQLNLFLLALLLGTAAFFWWGGENPAVALGLAGSGVIVTIAHASRRWLKMSLHAAFAVFAATLLWPNLWAVVLLLLLAVGVAWSRLFLQRHTAAEVVIGVLAGAAVGLVFNLVVIQTDAAKAQLLLGPVALWGGSLDARLDPVLSQPSTILLSHRLSRP
jgi:hypothetical protein